MCMYCYIGDHAFKYDPPWDIRRPWWEQPAFPSPVVPWRPEPIQPPAPVDETKPITEWNLDRLKEYLDVLKEIKRMEDELGCPCDSPEDRVKPDYIELFKARIEFLKAKSANTNLSSRSKDSSV